MGPGVTELTYSTPLLVERWENYTLTPGAGRAVGLGTHEPVRGATRFAQNIVHLVALSTGLWLKVCITMPRLPSYDSGTLLSETDPGSYQKA